jgi:negative regulator of flagellin synthesis FlgM
MKIGATNGVNAAQRVFPPVQPGDARGALAPAGSAEQGDKVEISGAARLRDAISQLPEIRADKVERARQMIASGEMDTPERLDAALDRLLDEL